MDAEALKRLWVKIVKRVFQTEKYYVTKRFDKTFAKFASWLNAHRDVDVERYMLAQILYMIDHGLVSKLYPNVLLGPRAQARYNEYLGKLCSKSYREQAYKAFVLQCLSFDRMCDYIGEAQTFSNSFADFQPVVLVFQSMKRGRTISDALRRQADLELYLKPWLEAVLPSHLLQEIRK